jgi:hypothetical protein
VIEFCTQKCNNKNAPIKSKAGENPAAQSPESKAELSHDRQGCREKQNRQKTAAQSQSVYNQRTFWSRPTDCRNAKSGKPDDAKSWVYSQLIVCDYDSQTAEEQTFLQG